MNVPQVTIGSRLHRSLFQPVEMPSMAEVMAMQLLGPTTADNRATQLLKAREALAEAQRTNRTVASVIASL